ncbi:MAG TPA: FkbM family methyltransferase [Burkholderiales bacterium]|nr:FkbM family methyltransferase [Burkholderiales bacterium]
MTGSGPIFEKASKIGPDPIALTLVDGVRVVVPDSLQLITPYVLREQEDWFEDEFAFLRELLEPGENAIDIGANCGVYTLTIARAVGPSGHVWAFEPASDTARLLAAGIDANGCANVTLQQCAISGARGTAELALHGHSELNALVRGSAGGSATETVRVETLDALAGTFGARTIDFLKIDAEGEEAAIIAGAAAFFERHSPLVQYEIKAGDQIHFELVAAFAARGYRSYRLVPGLGVLVPFEADAAPDPFLLNVFCCKADRAARLAARGKLVDRPERAVARPEHDWRESIAGAPYGRQLAASWQRTVDAGRSGDVEAALALHAMRRDGAYSAAQRFGALQESFRLLRALCEDEPDYLRLASLARVAGEYGARAVAVRALNDLYGSIARSQSADVSEPFLPPLARFDGLDPAGAIGKWVLGAVLEAMEKLAAYSSFYTGAGARERLQTIARLGFGSPEMQRRLALVNARFPV